MRVGFITTSRADFGIYLPLIRAVDEKENWHAIIYAGGMHLSQTHGRTLDQIVEQGFDTVFTKDTLLDPESEHDYARAIAQTTEAFAELVDRREVKPDVIFVLGDRFEMFAAASALVPFNIPIAHLHGGEDSLGALDQKYRNAITVLSDLHFASTEDHANKVSQIINTKKQVYNVGALGIETIAQTELLPREEFELKYGLNSSEEFILTTFHPETVHSDNVQKVNELIDGLHQIPLRVICTLPNADQQGAEVRRVLMDYAENESKGKMICLENMGIQGYFSAMKYCKMMIGNSSSGIIEAASFNKRVINVGDRQKGRTTGENVYHVPCDAEAILTAFEKYKDAASTSFENPYGQGDTAEKIISTLSNLEIK